MNHLRKSLLPLMLILVFSSCGGSSTKEEGVVVIVPPVATLGDVTLSWSAPSTNTDGSNLLDLAGYTIYYGEQSDNLSESIVLSDADTLTYNITDLTVGTTYYFSVTSVNSLGEESVLPSTVSKTVE